MEYSFIDVQQNLSIEHGVDFSHVQLVHIMCMVKWKEKLNRLINLYKLT